MAIREWHGIQVELSRTLWASSTQVSPVYYNGYQAKVQMALNNAVYRNAPLSLVAVPGQSGPAATLPDCSIVVTNSATPCLAELLTARERIHAATCERLKGIFDVFTSWLEYLTVEQWAQLEIESYEHELFFIGVDLDLLVPRCEPSFRLPENFSPHPVQELMLGERLLQELSVER